MKILVCVSKVPDTTTKISFTDNNTKFNTESVQYIINPSDEWYALVRALEIKEAQGGTVTLINVGNASNDAIIRKGLAIGGDNAVRIDCDPADSFEVAKHIADYAKSNEYDLVFTGKETIDYNGSEVAGMVAELLDMPYVALASKMDMAGNTATIERDIEGGKEVVEVSTPFVVSASKGLAEQRIPNMRGIMQARTKKLDVVTPTERVNKVSVANYELPPAKQAVKLIDPDNMDELVNLLQNEAKVL